MDDLFTADAHTYLSTWTDWLVLLLWFAGLIATFAVTWWASRGTVLALVYRLPSRVLENVIVAACGLVATAMLLSISPLPVGLTLIAAALALGLAAAGVGVSLFGYDHAESSEIADPGSSGAKSGDPQDRSATAPQPSKRRTRTPDRVPSTPEVIHGPRHPDPDGYS